MSVGPGAMGRGRWTLSNGPRAMSIERWTVGGSVEQCMSGKTDRQDQNFGAASLITEYQIQNTKNQPAATVGLKKSGPSNRRRWPRPSSERPQKRAVRLVAEAQVSG